ncbi:MAG TPA: hypothetical protein VFQ35_28455 [Polyangiaceae bacterium]|nr:hypothetical protein [Polyangiaceae bacterium]
MLRILFASSLLIACATGAPAKSPEAESEPESAVQEKTPGGESSSSDAPAEKASESASKPASNDDVKEVLQLVIDDEALGPYLHLDRPDRFPVRVAGSALPQGIELTKATKPVVIVPESEAEKKPTIVFTEIQVGGDDASVRYRYDVEKVRGSSTLKRRDGHWVLVRSRVSER